MEALKCEKTIKIIFAVFMSVLIICFSCVSALADTSVDSGTISLAYFQKLIKDNNFSLDCSLAELPVDDYLVVADYDTYYSQDYISFNFISRSAKKYVYLDNINSFDDFKKSVTADNNTIYLCRTSNDVFSVWFTFDYYTLTLSNSSKFVHRNVSETINKIASVILYSSNDINYIENMFVNEKSLFNKISEKTTVYTLIDLVRNKLTLDYCSSLFAYCTQLVPGYTGAVYDSSLENILSQMVKLVMIVLSISINIRFIIRLIMICEWCF